MLSDKNESTSLAPSDSNTDSFFFPPVFPWHPELNWNYQHSSGSCVWRSSRESGSYLAATCKSRLWGKPFSSAEKALSLICLCLYFQGKWNPGAGSQLRRRCKQTRWSWWHTVVPRVSHLNSEIWLGSGGGRKVRTIRGMKSSSVSPSGLFFFFFFCTRPKLPCALIIYSGLNSSSWCCGICFNCPMGAHTQRPSWQMASKEHFPFLQTPRLTLITYCCCFFHMLACR